MTTVGQEELQQLSEWFPRELEQSRKKGGATLTYIPVSEIIARANEVWGLAWSYRTVEATRYTDEFGDWVVAHVEVTVQLADGNVCTRDGFGGQDVSSMKNGKYVDLGDEYKGAVSDALKKALMSFGVALYLARNDRTGTTFAGVAKGDPAGADPSDPKVVTSDQAPAGAPVREDGVLEELQAVAGRAAELGINPPALLALCEKALGRAVVDAGAIHTHDEIEKVNTALDAIAKQKEGDK